MNAEEANKGRNDFDDDNDNDDRSSEAEEVEKKEWEKRIEYINYPCTAQTLTHTHG